MVDVGSPPQVLLPRIGLELSDIELLLVTHFHFDHMGMLPTLLGALAWSEASMPEPGWLTIAGPVGIREMTRRLVAAGYGRTTQERIEERVAPRFVVLQDGQEVTMGATRVRSHAVVHSTGPSLAYSVSRSSLRVGFSGDTTLCPGIRRLAAESDVLVCECSGMTGPVGGGHLWRGEVEELVEANPECRFVVNHLSARDTVRGALVAHDLLTLELPG